MKLNKDIFRVGDVIKLYRYAYDKDTIIVGRTIIDEFIISSIDLTKSLNVMKLNYINCTDEHDDECSILIYYNPYEDYVILIIIIIIINF